MVERYDRRNGSSLDLSSKFYMAPFLVCNKKAEVPAQDFNTKFAGDRFSHVGFGEWSQVEHDGMRACVDVVVDPRDRVQQLLLDSLPPAGSFSLAIQLQARRIARRTICLPER